MAAGKHHRKRKREQAPSQASAPAEASAAVEIEYVVEIPENLDENFSQAFDRLARSDVLLGGMDRSQIADSILDSLFSSNAGEEEEPTEQEKTAAAHSKKDMRKKHRPTVAQLKQIAPRPALVEVHDVTSPDPELLVYLKSRKCVVPVPRHWSSAAKYLAGKRGGLDKKPYQLPDYIVQTGIGKLRDAADDTNDSLQKRMRDRARPKLGQMSVDYHVLRDAFFKYQTKPRLTKHGELYFEGKEMEKDYTNFVPGVFSEELKMALGMSTVDRDGAHASLICPPPWLANMQRWGPPPSYAAMPFPGVNAPLPPGAQYGVTGWGKPPVDHFGRGTYGDVMGISKDSAVVGDAKVKLWGAFSQVEDEEEEDFRAAKRFRQEEEGEEELEEGEAVVGEEGEIQEIESYSFVAPPPPAVEKPPPAATLVPEQVVDLRKKAFRVLDQTAAAAATGGGGLFGSTHQYETVVSIAPENVDDSKEVAKRLEEERNRTQPLMGTAAGAAGLLDISQDVKKKPTKTSKKDKFKFS